MANHYPLSYSGRIIAEILGKILYFPAWWYSVGLARCARKAWLFLRDREKSLSLFVWIKNWFVPMYGQRDWVGRLISFLVRSVQIIIRGAALIFWLILAAIILLLWIIIPVLLIIGLSFQLAG